jgi:protein SCO1/2
MKQVCVPIRFSFYLIAWLAVAGTSFGAPACFAQSEASESELDQQEQESSDSDQPKNDPYRLNEKPDAAKNIGVDSHIGDFLEMDLAFNDEQNRRIKIGDYFDGQQPVMLSFNYSNCPKLCSVQLENMTSTLREIKFKVGEDFQVVSLSIDPTEQTSRARKTKELYTQQYNKKGSEDGWHFLTGDLDEIESLADICGFRYKYVREQKLYSHPPVFILISPEGKIVRYIHGLDYDPKTIELALIEAAEGKIGSPINILSYGIGCFTFNESTGKYTFQAIAIMRIGGAITALLLVVTLIPYWFLRRGTPVDEIDAKHGELSAVHPSGSSG